MKKRQYNELSEKIVDYVGGIENVENYTHCLTRLRFNIKDKNLVKEDDIKLITNVLGTNWAGNQIQVIIGTTVGDAFNEILMKHPSLSNRQGKLVKEDESPKEDTGKKKLLDKIIDVLTGCFSPIVPLLMGVGLLKVILLVCTLTGILTAEMSTYQVLTFAADAGFYFLPIFIAGTTANYFGGNLGLAFILGAILLHPTFVANYNDGVSMNLFGIPVFAANYSSTVFPSVMAVFVMCYVQKFFGKHSPALLRSIIEPLATLIVMIPLTLLLIAPAGSIIGTYLSSTVVAIYNTVGFFGVSIMCMLYPILVLTGMHRMFMPYQLQSFSSLGYEPFYITSAFISNFNQGVACLVVALKAKHNPQIRTLASTSSLTAFVAGITEPAMYGITTRYKKAFISALIGNFTGGLIAGILQVVCYAYPGSAGLFGFAAFLGEKGIMNVVYLLISIIIGVITTFIAAMIMLKPEEI